MSDNKDCWLCLQKAEWKQDKINTARELAHTMTETVAIVRNGCIFLVVTLNEIGTFEVIEYVNND